MGYSILFTDMDGTLLNSQSQISEGNKTAVRKAFEAGKQIIICSGRSWKSLAYFEKELELHAPERYGVAFNGGMAYEVMSQRILFERPMSNQLGLSLAKELAALDTEMLIYTGELLLARRETPQTVSYGRHTGLQVHYIDDDFSAVTGPVHKIILHDTMENLQAVERIVAPRFEGLCNIFFSSPTLIEFAHPGTHKGTGLRFLTEYLHTPLAEAIAVGDQANDIEILREAGLGIAVANAAPGAADAADVVLPETNDQDAVARAIYEYLL